MWNFRPLYIPNSRSARKSAQRKSAHKRSGARDVTIRVIRFLEGRGSLARKSCSLLILMGKKSEKVRTQSEIFLLEGKEAAAEPLYRY